MSMGSRIKEARTRAGLKQEELGKMLGRGKSQVSSWENDRNKPDPDVIDAICQILDVSPNWIHEWDEKQERFLDYEEQSLVDLFRKLDRYDRETVKAMISRLAEKPEPELINDDIPMRPIDVYMLRPSAGTGNVMLDEVETVQLEIPLTIKSKKADFGVRVDGRSMEPMLQDGELLLIQKSAEVNNGQIGIFGVNGDVVVKQKLSDRLHSLNPDYPDIEIHDGDSVICYGKVLN